jgi:ABC-type dipeptide/oligopeptide/nickel transport system permease component
VVTVIGKRVAGSLLAIFGASILSFVLMRILPGDPVRLALGAMPSKALVHAQYVRMGLDQPWYVQYWRYMSAFFRGDWGFSYSAGEPVTTQIVQRLPATIELALVAFAVALAGAVVLALLVTYRKRRHLDRTVRGIALVGFGTPQFFAGIVLLLVFSYWFKILPSPDGRLSMGIQAPPTYTHLYTIDALIAGQFGTFGNAVSHLVLPAITLALLDFSFLVRLLRANLLEVSREPFILVVRSKGMGRWDTHRKHALRNAFLPTITVSALVLGDFLAGAVLVEKVFNWPGVGALVADSIVRQDFSVVQAFVLLTAFMYVFINLMVDLAYALIDPRVRIASIISKS